MFRGRHEHAIDGKGRTSLPSRFREVLAANGDSRIIMTTGLDPCVVVYPLNAWLEFEEQVAKLPQFDEAAVLLRRTFVSGAIDCDVDKLGRVLVPSSLRDYAGLTRDAVWSGNGKNIELWDKGRFDRMHMDVLADPEKKREMKRRLTEMGV